jgi:hypothetical protein
MAARSALLADVNANILDMIKAGDLRLGQSQPGHAGLYGLHAAWLANHPDLIDLMNDAKRSNLNGMAVPPSTTASRSSPGQCRRLLLGQASPAPRHRGHRRVVSRLNGRFGRPDFPNLMRTA